MSSASYKASGFDHRPDGLERTEWFNARHTPDLIGYYEVCAWKGADIIRCFWDGENWSAAVRLADKITVGLWRGLTEEAHLLAVSKSAT